MPLSQQAFLTLAGEVSSTATLKDQVTALVNNLKITGTALYNDANLLTAYPTDGPALRTWLASTNVTLNNFLNALSQMPTLNS